MLTYETAGNVLILHVRGTPTESERHATYDAIAKDPNVPAAALVLLDARRADAPGSLADVEHRAHTLVERLGDKLGAACAVIVPPRLAAEAEHIEALAPRLGIQIGLFRDEPDARNWLRTFE